MFYTNTCSPVKSSSTARFSPSLPGQDHDPVTEDWIATGLAHQLEPQRLARDRPRVRAVALRRHAAVLETAQVEAARGGAERDGVAAAPLRPQAERPRIRQVFAIDDDELPRSKRILDPRDIGRGECRLPGADE